MWRPASLMEFSWRPLPRSQASAPLWLKVLVIVMGLLIVVGFVVIAAEIARRMSSASTPAAPPAAAHLRRAHRAARRARRWCRSTGAATGSPSMSSARRAGPPPISSIRATARCSAPSNSRRGRAASDARSPVDHHDATSTAPRNILRRAALGALGYPAASTGRAEAMGYGVRDHGHGAPATLDLSLHGQAGGGQPALVLPRQKPRRRARLPSGGSCQRRLRRRTAGHPREIQPRLLRRLRARSRRQPDRSRDAPTRGMSMNFRSDNEVGAHPAIIEAVGRAFAGGSATPTAPTTGPRGSSIACARSSKSPTWWPIRSPSAPPPTCWRSPAARRRGARSSAIRPRISRSSESQRAGILLGGRQARPHRGPAGKIDPAARRGAGPAGLRRRASSRSPPRSASPRRPSAAPSTRRRRSPPSSRSPIATG